MIIQSLTVGTSAVQVPDPTPTFPAVANLAPNRTVQFIARQSNSGSVYVGTASTVTTSTGALVPQQNTSFTAAPQTLVGPAPTGSLYFIGSAAGQIVDVYIF